MPFQILRNTLFDTAPQRLLQERGLLSALRASSEAPFAKELRQHGAVSVDKCASIGFRSRKCDGHRVASHRNASLLAAFYRQRDPGFSPAFIARLKGSDNPLMKVSGLLAEADRRRNLGKAFAHELNVAFDELRNFLYMGFPIESLIPTKGAPQHLIWHFLDKLSLQLHVLVEVKSPFDGPAPQLSEVKMSVLPDHDIVSDYVRRMGEFHCPSLFTKLVAEAAAAGTWTGTAPLRVLEVGGFLGDCLIWAAAWLGPARLKALEIEPVAPATRRLAETLAWAGFSDAVSVVTEAVGDGNTHELGVTAGGSSTVAANPNFGVQCAGLKAMGGRCARVKHRSLDEILTMWLDFPSDAVLDLVRIKAAGSELRIVSGLRQHFAAGRVRRLYVQTVHKEAVQRLFEQWPHYRFDEALFDLHKGRTSQGLVYRLTE